VYRTNRNVEEVGFQDPKRVHQALREFNDLSANSVFQHMLEQIAQLEKDQGAQGGLGFSAIGGKQVTAPGKAGGAGKGGAAEATPGEETPQDIIKNVEKMLQQEKQAAKVTAKGGAKVVSFDMNEGMVGSVTTKAAAKAKAATTAAPGQSLAQQAAAKSAAIDSTADSASTAATAAQPAQTVDAGGNLVVASAAADAGGELDEDIQLIRRKTLAVKADNINDVFMENIGAITESV